MELVFKYSAQGLSHGHYDKLALSLYEKGDEVLQDYGMVRYVNVEQKGGGNYLPENASWAKQSIAHNTLTLNSTSHFQGKYEIGSQHHSELYFFDDTNPDVQVMSATESNAYPGTEMKRTVAMIKSENLEKPFVLDIFKVHTDSAHNYDLPFYYLGQPLEANFDYTKPSSLNPLGVSNGYQHLYLEGVGKPNQGTSKFSWLSNNRFYTLTSVASDSDKLLFTRIGANDPDFNLRSDPAFMIRRENFSDTVFVTTIESHGSYSPVNETATNSKSSIKELKVIHDDEDYTAITIEDVYGQLNVFLLSNGDSSKSKTHRLAIDGKPYTWEGAYHYIPLK